jgi:negative regulator of sigma E activity
VNGHVVTAVGEVPLETVRDVATSVVPVEIAQPPPNAPR